MDIINTGVDMHELESMTWECESFWKKIDEYHLYEELDVFLCKHYNGIASLNDINDFIRYEGDTILTFLGLSKEEIDG